MWRLAAPRVKNPRTNDHEHGAISVLTAVCMVALLFVVAVVVNVGISYAEKAQLQNGADAAALAVANTCAGRATTTPCVAGVVDGPLQTLANSMVNSNSNDGSSSVILTMGTGTVTATVSTVSSDGNKIILPISGVNATVRALAAATWGGIYSGMPVIPITVGGCELDPTKYPMDGTDRVVLIHGTFDGHGSNKEIKCDSWNPEAGLNMPGGFGWLDTSDGCKPNITIDDPWVDSKTGASIPTGCGDLFTPELVGQTVLIPIFGYKDGTGSNGEYEIVGWGVFVVRGWHFPSTTVNWPVGNGAQGLYGHFVKTVSYKDGFTMGGTTTYGASQVKLTK
jgi:Flp pilus assembly protein TadG